MYREPEAMKEIHEIREKMYEEMRGLSDKEIIEKYRKEAAVVRKKYGLKLRKSASLFLAIVLILFLCGVSFAEETIKDGVKKEFYFNGKIKNETNYKNGKKDGTTLTYDEDGKLSGEWYWKDGTFLGYKAYYPNGHLRQEVINSKDGRVEENVKDYYESGQLLLEIISQNNEKRIKKYYPNGQLQSDGLYRAQKTNQKDIRTKDSKTGKVRVDVKSIVWETVDETVYDEQGKVLEEGIYKEYSENGKLESEKPYKKTKAILNQTRSYNSSK